MYQRQLDAKRFRLPLTLCLIVFTLVIRSSLAVAQDPLPVAGDVADNDGEVRIPIRGGSVDSKVLFDAISKDLHWVAGSITAFTKTFEITSLVESRVEKESLDDLVRRFPKVFRYKGDANDPSMLIVDTESLSRQLANHKSGLRRFLAGVQGTKLTSLDKVEGTWAADEASSPPRVVVLLAGLHGTETSAAEIAKAIHRRTNLPMCVFRYPNDGPVAESAGMFVLRMEKFHQEHPSSNVTLVTHSMGGLVARAALEMNLVVASGNLVQSTVDQRTGVDQLIQICPPNHGSALAEYGPLLEGAEQLYRIINRGGRRDRVLFRSIVDGFNEATTDLEPNSAFLRKLNACARNKNVEYTVLLGDAGPLRPAMSLLVSGIWDTIATSVEEPAELDRRIRQVVECKELQQGKGDGVVSVRSAQLPGVADQVKLPMHHLVWNELDTEAGKQLLNEVCSRLGVSL